MIIGQGLRLALAGLAIGIVASLVLTRLLVTFADLLYGVKSNDPLYIFSVFTLLQLLLFWHVTSRSPCNARRP